MAGSENSSQYCAPALNSPEQINLQYASPTAVVVCFVTYEIGGGATADAPPQATLATQQVLASASAANITIFGVTHRYAPHGRNGTTAPKEANQNTLPYMMHYVTLPVEPGHEYVAPPLGIFANSFVAVTSALLLCALSLLSLVQMIHMLPIRATRALRLVYRARFSSTTRSCLHVMCQTHRWVH